MADSVGVILQIRQDAEDDAAELAQLAGWLRAELLELEVQSVDPLPSESVPAGAKGAEAIVGWLLVQLGPGGLGTLLAKLRSPTGSPATTGTWRSSLAAKS